MTSLVDMPVSQNHVPDLTRKPRFGENLFMKVKSVVNQVAFVRKDQIQHMEFVSEGDTKTVKISLLGGQWLTYNIDDYSKVTW